MKEVKNSDKLQIEPVFNSKQKLVGYRLNENPVYFERKFIISGISEYEINGNDMVVWGNGLYIQEAD